MDRTRKRSISIWGARNLDIIVEQVLRGVDLVVPDRGDLRKARYPESQIHAERLGRTFVQELTGVDLDLWVGTRGLSLEAVPFFLNYDGNKFTYETREGPKKYGDGWDCIFIPVLRMLREGKTVIGVPINYTHPPDQTAIEQGDVDFTFKRLGQLDNLMPSMHDYWGRLQRSDPDALYSLEEAA